jgi:hypothetical protein
MLSWADRIAHEQGAMRLEVEPQSAARVAAVPTIGIPRAIPVPTPVRIPFPMFLPLPTLIPFVVPAAVVVVRMRPPAIVTIVITDHMGRSWSRHGCYRADRQHRRRQYCKCEFPKFHTHIGAPACSVTRVTLRKMWPNFPECVLNEKGLNCGGRTKRRKPHSEKRPNENRSGRDHMRAQTGWFLLYKFPTSRICRRWGEKKLR